jgi:hypothetical protein
VKKILVFVAVVVLAGGYWLLRPDDAPEKSQVEAPAVSAAGVTPLQPLRPGAVYEDKGVPHGVAPALFEAPTSPGQEVRLGLGDTTNLKFNQPRAHTGMGVGRMTAKAFRAQDKPIELEVTKTDKGVEVPFTPPGPGQFNVVLSENGNPVGAQLVGVVGAVGAADLTDPDALFDADPVEFRARTPGRLSSR